MANDVDQGVYLELCHSSIMGIRRVVASAKAHLGLLAVSIAANLMLFAYLFGGKDPNVEICGVIGGIAGGLLLLCIERSPSAPSGGGEFLTPPVSERQPYRRSA